MCDSVGPGLPFSQGGQRPFTARCPLNHGLLVPSDKESPFRMAVMAACSVLALILAIAPKKGVGFELGKGGRRE